METKRLFDAEARFLRIIWDSDPVPSGALVEKCRDALGWKKSTTYTMLRRVMAKGMVRNDDSLVSVLIPRDRVQRFESERIVSKSFGGSLPSFLTAFLGDRTLTDSEADELIDLIDKYRNEN